MAKQAVSSFERHVDKGVLGLTVLALLAAVALYLVKSPNTTELDSQRVGPAQIDEKVRQKTQNLRSAIAQAKPEVVQPEDPLAELKDREGLLASGALASSWPAPVSMLPKVPDVGPVVIAGEKILAEVLPPQKPKVVVGRSTLVLLPSVYVDEEAETLDEEEQRLYLTPVNWCTVAAVVNRKDQARACKLAGYEPGRRQAYYVAVELHRRQQGPDGSWPE
ncbi:MAG: hypothetical protein ACE5GE_16930, partial [Phycisphaerae bacterium]